MIFLRSTLKGALVIWSAVHSEGASIVRIGPMWGLCLKGSHDRQGESAISPRHHIHPSWLSIWGVVWLEADTPNKCVYSPGGAGWPDAIKWPLIMQCSTCSNLHTLQVTCHWLLRSLIARSGKEKHKSDKITCKITFSCICRIALDYLLYINEANLLKLWPQWFMIPSDSQIRKY